MNRLLVRDLVILGLTLVAWLFVSVVPDLAIPAAVGAGFCAFQFHEWGHWFGGRHVNAVMMPARVLWSPFLFQFDAKGNSRRQFLHMSWPGFLATAIFVVFFKWGLSENHPSTELTRDIAYVLAGITVVVEGPLALWTLLGGRVLPVPVWLPGRNQ